MKHIIALNLKTYPESLGNKGLELVRIAKEVSEEAGARIIVAPQFVDLRDAVKLYKDVYAQHVSVYAPGARTGSIPVEAVAGTGCRGSLLNHSERRRPDQILEQTMTRMKDCNLECMLCTKDTAESVKFAEYEPTFLAVEPPELIGSGISVSTAKPELVSGTVEAVAKINATPVLCGAGVSNAADVKKAIELGAKGVLLASAFVKAENPRKLLLEMAHAID